MAARGRWGEAMATFAMDYVLGRRLYTVIVHAATRTAADYEARDEILGRRRLVGASMQGSPRPAGQDDYDAAQSGSGRQIPGM